jgi:hypothetical protein
MQEKLDQNANELKKIKSLDERLEEKSRHFIRE